MTFSSIEALRAYLQSKLVTALEIAREQIFQIFKEYLTRYYGEFTPEIYKRTQQLANSLVKGGITGGGSSVQCEIYFDSGMLNYTTGTWSGEQVLDSAAHGSHGGYVSGTAIWDEPIVRVLSEGKDILKNAIIAAGIPVH